MGRWMRRIVITLAIILALWLLLELVMRRYVESPLTSLETHAPEIVYNPEADSWYCTTILYTDNTDYTD